MIKLLTASIAALLIAVPARANLCMGQDAFDKFSADSNLNMVFEGLSEKGYAIQVWAGGSLFVVVGVNNGQVCRFDGGILLGVTA